MRSRARRRAATPAFPSPSGAGRLVHDVDAAVLRRERRGRHVLRRDVARADRLDPRRLRARPLLARVDDRLEVGRAQRERAEQSDGARAEHERAPAVAVVLARPVRALPGQSLLHLPELDQRLLGDRERLDEDGDLAQRRGHGHEVLLVLDDTLGQEAVRLLDAALAELAREAEVLAPAAARDAVLVRARPPHHRHHPVAGPHARHRRAHALDLRQRLVAEHEVIAARGRRAVLEAADLTVGAAHADLDHAQPHAGRRLDRRLGQLEPLHLARLRNHGDRPHACLLLGVADPMPRRRKGHEARNAGGAQRDSSPGASGAVIRSGRTQAS